ncbi:hypothetical protein ATZ33_08760 [Enterococcus silesiacus]|uniref:Cell wall protein n=1 Tax=Enterococcus silesiacus TaxID=332949 RepID=A0A0S3KAW1_9ENTE|nr:hypothetical protein [Enterococcus silesiacus]ALS01453.1 hypothetical protein ATZ33_08760 [Enterococcus silesiacus]OJG87749.1 hypothetical protein RV15_GL001882 [Enterococcus silesiacus]
MGQLNTTNKKGWHLLLLFLFSILSVGIEEVSVHAEALPPGMVIGDSEGLYATSEGEYFIDLVDVMPGYSFTKEITIRNVDVKEGFKLSLLVKAGKNTGPIDFTDAVKVELEHEGKIIYAGGLLGNDQHDWTSDPLPLGVYESGGESVLKARFTVSSSLGLEDYKEPSEYQFHWIFDAESKAKGTTEIEAPIFKPEPSKKKDEKKSFWDYLPRTGEEIENFLYKVCAAFFVLVIILLLKRFNKDNQNGEAG